MKNTRWIQTEFDFLRFEYNHQFKKLMRLYTLSNLNNSKLIKSGLEKYQENYKRINNKILKQDVIWGCFAKKYSKF